MEDSDHQSGTLKVARSMNHRSTQYGALISSNEDLLTEILIRLPVTSILRFKSVSKHWRLLLTNSHLTHRYDNNNLSKSPLGLFACTHITNRNYSPTKSIYVSYDVENRSTPPFSNLDFYFNRSGVRIVHSCNGVREYYVFNPTTQQLALIPSVPKNIRAMALAFHQKECVCYKVVCIRALEPDGDLFHIQVYSSDTRTWNICTETFSEQVSNFQHPVYCNGAVHWAPNYNRGSNFLYFKLDVEQLHMLSLPVEKMSYERNIMYFGGSLGHLHLIFHTDSEEYEDVLRVNVYEMLMDHSGWLVKYRVHLNELLDDFPFLLSQYCLEDDFGEAVQFPFQNDFKVVDLVRGNEEQDTIFLVLLTGGKLIRYNAHDKSFKELYNSNNLSLQLLNLHRYVETLTSF